VLNFRKPSRLIIISAVVLAAVLSVGFAVDSFGASDNVNLVYSFSGGDDLIAINNGQIVINDKQEEFVGGNLTFIGERPSNVKYLSSKFYFYNCDGIENIVLNNIGRVENGSSSIINIPTDMGTASSKTLFNAENLGIAYK